METGADRGRPAKTLASGFSAERGASGLCPGLEYGSPEPWVQAAPSVGSCLVEDTRGQCGVLGVKRKKKKDLLLLRVPCLGMGV